MRESLRHRRVQTALLTALLIVACSIAHGSNSEAEETWEVVRSGSSAFGSLHTRTQKLESGERRIERQTRYLLDVLGHRQQIKEDREWIIGAALAPRSCRLETHGPAAATKVEGRLDGRQFKVTIVRAGSTLERVLDVDDETIFDVCLPEYLSQQPPDRSSVKLAIIDTDSWKRRVVQAKRLPSVAGEAQWKVGDDVWTFDSKGAFREVVVSQPNRKIVRATAEEAAAIEHLKYSPRELLVFPLKKDIAFPERAKRIAVRLTWQEFPIESLQLEDSRQRITSREQNGDRFQVDLELTQPATVENPPAIPIADPALAEYLASDRYIMPRDKVIRDKALEWSQGSTNAFEAVRALSRNVAQYLQGGELIAETLSGPEVLACRKGKCSEFTTLLASLSRSLGIPTRVALGMRLAGGQWVGHMWCEAWVGKWIPVDATADEVGGSPALLKLTHSSSVEGTQQVRWAMTRSLDVEVQSYEVERRGNSDLKTGIARQSYTNADFGCRITAPADWTWLDKSKPSVPTLQCKLAEGEQGADAPLIHFVAFALPSKLDASVLVKSRSSQFASTYTNFEVTTDEPIRVGSVAGRQFAFRRADPKDPGKVIKTTEIILTNDRSGYIINLIAEASRHDAVLDQFKELWNSFESLETPGEPE